MVYAVSARSYFLLEAELFPTCTSQTAPLFCQVKNTVMTFEPFHCSFVGDKQGFEVSPVEGTLARRGGEPTTLDVSFLGRVSTRLSWSGRSRPVVCSEGFGSNRAHLVQIQSVYCTSLVPL